MTENEYKEMFEETDFSWDDGVGNGEDEEVEESEVEEEETNPIDTDDDEAESEEPTENEDDEDLADDDDDTTDFVELKHLGEIKKVSRGEAKKLAQKGLDYDRIRGKYDELKGFEGKADQLKFLEELATAYGQPIEEVIEDWRIRKIAEDERVSEDKARAEYYKRQLKNGGAKSAPATDPIKEKQTRDFAEMKMEYPSLNPKDIPKEVWDAYTNPNNKRSLYAIYTSHINKVTTSKTKNTNRSMGSVKSKGGSRKGGWGVGFNDDL